MEGTRPGIEGSLPTLRNPSETNAKRSSAMSRQLLMQSVLGHLALLAEKHPKKAATPVARRAMLFAEASLRPRRQPLRQAA